MQHLAGTISFDATNQRRRSRNAVEKFIADWNAAHPVEERLTLVSMTEITVADEDDNGDPTGLNLPALQFEYTTPSEATVTTMFTNLYQDTTANNFNDILSLQAWYTEG